MEKNNRDILSEKPYLKEMPYSVPEGYFEAFKANAAPYQAKSISLAGRLVPYISMAAMFIFLLTVGTLFLQKTSSPEMMTQEDYLVFSGDMMNTVGYEMEYGDQIADAEIANEDIINYLIYSGVTLEEIELSK